MIPDICSYRVESQQFSADFVIFLGDDETRSYGTGPGPLQEGANAPESTVSLVVGRVQGMLRPCMVWCVVAGCPIPASRWRSQRRARQFLALEQYCIVVVQQQHPLELWECTVCPGRGVELIPSNLSPTSPLFHQSRKCVQCVGAGQVPYTHA